MNSTQPTGSPTIRLSRIPEASSSEEAKGTTTPVDTFVRKDDGITKPVKTDVVPEAKVPAQRTCKQFFAAPLVFVWGAITGGASKTWGVIKGATLTVCDAIKTRASKAWGAIKGATLTVCGAIKTGGQRIAEFASRGWNGLCGLFLRKTKDVATKVVAEVETQEASRADQDFTKVSDKELPKAS